MLLFKPGSEEVLEGAARRLMEAMGPGWELRGEAAYASLAGGKSGGWKNLGVAGSHHPIATPLQGN